jgi:2'-5' RNA ligase
VTSKNASWFIALPVPEDDARAWLARVPEPPANFRLFVAADLHLTIAFLGGCGEERARAAWDALALPLAPLTATLGPLVALGNPRRYSALGARLGDGRAEVEAAMTAARDEPIRVAGAEPETRPALAHVTLARPARKARPADRRAGLDWAAKVPVGQRVQFAKVALYTISAGAADGARYRSVVSRGLSLDLAQRT